MAKQCDGALQKSLNSEHQHVQFGKKAMDFELGIRAAIGSVAELKGQLKVMHI